MTEPKITRALNTDAERGSAKRIAMCKHATGHKWIELAAFDDDSREYLCGYCGASATEDLSHILPDEDDPYV